MPVDPGNLLLVGSRAGVPVVGAPGCARSPKENGFDWILHRLLADLPVTRADIVALERDLSESLGTIVNVLHGRGGKGRLVIHYTDLDTLEGVLERLKVRT